MYRVCFVAPLARPILEPSFVCDFGGAEVRAVNFANGLARDIEFDVSMVLRSYRRESPRRIDRITAYFETIDAPLPRTRDLPRDGLFLWNLLRIKLQKLERSLRKRRSQRTPEQRISQLIQGIPADLICCFGVDQFSATVIQAAKAANKRSLLFTAREQDVDGQRHNEIVQAYGGDAVAYRGAIGAADAIVTQTAQQQDLLHKNFGRTAHLIRNPVKLQDRKLETSNDGEYILWVGRAEKTFKRADTMLLLAAKCPDVPFVAIMNKRDDQVFYELVNAAPDNLKIVSHVPYSEIETYYAKAKALLSTSISEGFPNAFLQAGKYGRPILSLHVDPGEMMTRHECGCVTHGDLDALVDAITDIWHDQDGLRRQTMSANIRRYVETYHSDRERIAELQHVIRSLAASSRSQAA